MTKEDRESKTPAQEDSAEKIEYAIERLEKTEKKLEQIVGNLEQTEARLEQVEEKAEHAGKHQSFKIQIDKAHFEIKNPTPTGKELLTLAEKIPPERFAIYLKIKGGQPQSIGLEGEVDLREPGTERFVTLPLDQTEG